MKIEFIEGKYEGKIDIPKKVFDKLRESEKIAVYTTINYINFLPGIIKKLEEKGANVYTSKLPHCFVEGQILGCSFLDINFRLNKNIDTYFYIGDGLFHPKSVMFKILKEDENKKVFTFNPKTKVFSEIKEKDAKKIMQKYASGMKKFLVSKNIGILVSKKYGQQRLNEALKLKKSGKYKDKNFFIFVDDNFGFQSLENFNFIDCWINTACPRIAYDDSVRLNKPIIDISEIEY